MVIMASSIAGVHVYAMMMMTLHKMAAILQLIGQLGHAALVYNKQHPCYGQSDSCQNKVSTDQYHTTISWAQILSSLRSHVFLKLTAV